jgi:hypothetical protein
MMRNAINWSRLALCALLVGGLGGLTACDDAGGDIGISETPAMQITPASLVFPKVEPGGQAEREVEIRNNGNGDLLIANIALGARDASEYELFFSTEAGGEQRLGISSAGENNFNTPVRVPAGESLFFNVVFRPESEDENSGQITLETNDPENADAVIPIQQSDVGAEINVSPRTVDFGRVAANDENEQEVTVTNIGQVPLEITNILLNGSQDFTPLIDGKDPRRQPEVLEDPDNDGEPGLGPNQSFVIIVRYAPLVEGPDAGALSIFSSDPATPEVVVDLSANGATPCIEVNPPAVEFRTSLVNRTDSRPLNIASCGGSALRIEQILIGEGSDPAFELDVESLPDLPAELPAAADQAPLPSRAIRVQFTPREQRIYNGKLVIISTAPGGEEAGMTADGEQLYRTEISLLGRGVLNACPQARAVQDEFQVVPLDVITLDGSISIDQDGPNNQPVEYEWVIIDSPDGSVSQPVERFFNNQQPANGGEQDDRTTPTAQFFVDLAGTYTLELRVRDNLGLGSVECENPAVVTIVAQPDQAILIQLVWSTPTDPDETDGGGADLDLHLLHPNADSWFSSPYDCHYQNPVPDWGQLENPADDPSLDIDDINGAGPENISLNIPENTEVLGAPYLVGVHYYSSQDRLTQFDYGPSIASLRIFIDGELAWDFTEDDNPGEREMMAQDHFWDAAQIDWPARRVTTRNQYSEQRP